MILFVCMCVCADVAFLEAAAESDDNCHRKASQTSASTVPCAAGSEVCLCISFMQV